MATKVKPAAASSKTPPELEEKKSAASDTELKQRGLDDALFTLLKQLSRTALHSTTSLQAVIDVLDKEEYRNLEEVKLITMDHLQEWFKGARKTQDVLLKLFSASGPTPARPSDDIKEFIQSFQKLSTKNKRSVWKEPAPTTFGPADTTNEWFMAHVREWALSWLQNTLQLEDWPSCEEIYLKATPASSCLLSWLKENGITVTCNPRPAWLEDVATLGDAHLSRLANSWVLDTTAYGAIPHAQPLPLEHNIVIKRVKALYEGPIDSSWMSAAIGSEYIRHLEAMSMHWQKLQYQTSELELTGGVLSHVFDSCYAICAPDFLRTTKGVLTTQWRRNIKDPNAAMLDLPATLPDGRLEVEVQLQDQGIVKPSMIIVEDKAADYEFKDFQMDNVSKGDLETALIEAHRSVVAIHKARPLISEKASEICVLAIHTRWPRVWVYGMSMLRDRSSLAYELGKYNLMAPGAGTALRELCFRTLLVVKHNLDVLLDPHNYSPRDPGMPPMDNWGKKDPGSKVSSETSEPKASSTPSKPTKGQAQYGAPSGGKQSVHIEKRVWKLPTRSGEEEEILRELGGRHHFPALLSAAAPEDVPAGAFAMLYYRDRHVTSMDEARVLTSDLAEALHYLHSCGYVHCDVKRPNVRFDGTQAVLIDLDLARRWREGDAPLACTPGTVGWRAPELQGDNPQLTNKVDLYGLGLVLLDELLVLAYPHSAWRVSRFSFDCSFSFLAGFLGPSTGIEAVRLLAELLNKRPSHRPSAEQVLCSPFVRHKEALAERVCQPLAHQKSQSGTTLPTLAIAPTSTPTVAAIANQSDKKTPQLIIYRDPVETPRPVAARPVKENKGKRTALQERPLNRLDGN